MNFKQYIEESVNDKGRFKSIFMAGSPGSGKTYVISKIDNANVQPRLVSIDKIHEFSGPRKGFALSDYKNWNKFEGQIKGTFREQLALYINSMLPLWVDGTSSEINNTLKRIGILEYFGYDIAMLWVNTNVDVAIKRAAARDRQVPPEFIQRAHNLAEENKKFYQQKIPNFIEANNNDGELNDHAIQTLFKTTSNFFLSPIENPIGKRCIERLRADNAQFLIPSVYSKEQLIHHLMSWYNSN